MKLLHILAIALCIALALCDPTPPIYPDSFEVRMDQTFVAKNGSKYRVNSYLYYDAKNNRERVDRNDGSHNLFCSTVLPNVTTPCNLLAVNNKRYIIYPSRQQCCFCCDSAHGCGILKKDWISDGQYKGSEAIGGTQYDKWSKDGTIGYNYLWVTKDQNKIPRRLDENGEHITDYLTHTYINKTIADSVFAVPSYCKDNCPLTSFCGKLRQNSETKLTLTKEE